MLALHVREFKMAPAKRKLFCKEFKLKVTNWYFESGKNISETANNFQIDRKQVRNWLKDEEKIPSLKCSRKAYRSGKAYIPVMEKELYTTFLDMQNEGKFVKR